jgi:SPP1 gp7 family putative phage head morphogenesis protein
MENLIEGVETGLYTPDNLPEWYYTRVAEALYSAVELGFGSTLVELEFGGVDYVLLSELQTNIYVFSAAKTYQQVREMSALLVKYKDRPDLFKKEAQKIFQDYNTPKGANYLSAEYQTAKASARSAVNWTGINAKKDLFPLLEYQTQGDARVRPTHVELDGIVREVDDIFWDSYYPPNGWRCRCYTLSHVEGDLPISDMSGFTKPKDVPDLFLMNSGKDKIIFSEKHPYFDVAKGDKDLAMNNFNLPLL